MVDGGLGPMVAALRPLVAAVVPRVKVIAAERAAAKNPFGEPKGKRALDEQLSETFVRLGAIQNADSGAWWKNLLLRIEQEFVQPDLFEVDSIREWLGCPQVQEGLKELARAQLQALPDEPAAVRSNLRKKYEVATQEAQHFADGPIDIVVAVLLAGCLAPLTPEGKVLLDVGQGISRQVAGVHDEVLELKARLPPVGHPLIDQEVQRSLRTICRRRGIHIIDSRSEIGTLVSRIDSGDLRAASPSLIGEVLHWAARLNASDAASAEVANGYLDRAAKIDPKSVHAPITRAWLLFNEGKVEEALQSLRSQTTPDASTVKLHFIHSSKGRKAALEWFDAQGEVGNDFFSALGWKNLAIIMHEEGRWEDALGVFTRLTDRDFAEEPDAAFVLGTIYAGFLLPEPIRINALKFTIVTPRLKVIEGADADRHRAEAIRSFNRARALMMEVGAEDRAQACDYWLLWLGLSDPKTKEETAADLRSRMEEGGDALNFVDLAITHGVKFDVDAAEQHFRLRRLEGGLTPQEQVGLLSLLRFRASLERVLEYLDTAAEDLKGIEPQAFLAMMRVEAFIKAGRFDDAEAILDHEATLKDDDDAARARLAIADGRGLDVAADAVRLYEQSKLKGDQGYILGDLKNVVAVLQKDKRRLLPYAEDHFRLERTAWNLGLLIDCSTAVHGHSDSLKILEANDDLLRVDDEAGRRVLVRKVDALFHLGMFKEARAVNDRLLDFSPDDLDYVHDDLNIALRSGDWEHFNAVADCLFDKRNELEPTLLLRLAHLVGDVLPAHAMDFIRTVAAKAPEDANALFGCYMLATQIGQEKEEAGEWLKRAIDLSKDGGGPVQSMSLQEVVERMPVHAQENDRFHRQFWAGELPVHLAAIALHVQVTRVLVSIPRANESERDPRKRVVIPIRAGSRTVIDAGSPKVMAFDVSTLLLLQELGLLDAVVRAVGHVKVSPRVMDFLAHEIRALPYHQPSVVDAARTLVKYLDRHDIAVLTEEVDTDPRHLSELGEEMARLISAAKKRGGRLVSVAQVHKVGSLTGEIADWGDASELVLTTIQLTDLLRTLGYIDRETFDSAVEFLRLQDRGPPPNPENNSAVPLFIDNLALNYLGHAGVLENLARSGIALTIDVSTEREARDLIHADEVGKEAAKVLHTLRRSIAEYYRKGTMSFLAEARPEGLDKDEKEDRAAVLYDLFHDVEAIDAIAVDDRMLGRHANATDATGRTVPMLGIVELLYLPGITEEQRVGAFRRLWRRGFAFLPLLHDQLRADLWACALDDETGSIRETAELKAVRQTLCGIRSMKMLRLGDEHTWLDHLAQTAYLTIRETWSDETVPEVRACAITAWLVENVMPWPVDWQDSVSVGHWIDLDQGMAERLFHLLLLRPAEISQDRQEAYARWLDDRVVRSLGTANPQVVAIAARMLAEVIENGVKEIVDELDG